MLSQYFEVFYLWNNPENIKAVIYLAGKAKENK